MIPAANVSIDSMSLGSLVVQFRASGDLSSTTAQNAVASASLASAAAAYSAAGGTDAIGVLDVSASVQSAPKIVALPACEFQCRSTSGADCVSLFALCDGTKDCADNSDEQQCFQWREVEKNATLSLPLAYRGSGTALFATTTAEKCKAIAMSNGSMAFSFNRNTLQCEVYQHTHNATGRFTFASLLISATADTSIFTLLSTPSQYLRCSDELTCSGHGYSAMTPSGVCGCVCDALYTGTNCQQLQSIKAFSSVYLSFTTSSAISALSSTTVSTALHTWFPTGNFTCDLPLKQSSVTTFLCRDLNGSLTADVVANTSSLTQFNAAFLASTGLPNNEAAIRLATSASAPFEPQDSCDFTVDKMGVQCRLARPTPVDALIVQLATNDLSQPTTIRATLHLVDSNRVSGGGSQQQQPLNVTTMTVDCASIETVVTQSGTQVHRCLLDATKFPPGMSLLDYNATLVGQTTGQPTVLQTKSEGVEFVSSFRRSLQVPSIIDVSHVTVHSQSFQSYRDAGIALLVSGAVILLIVVLLLFLHSRAVDSVTEETKNDHFVVRYLRQLALVDDPEAVSLKGAQGEEENAVTPALFNKRHAGFLFLSLFAVLWVLGIFLILYYAFSSDVTRDAWPTVERYADSQCASSTFAPTPLASFFVGDEATADCMRRQIVGAIANSGGFYFSGWCEELESGAVVARFRTGQSKGECSASSATTVQPGSCIPSGTLWGTSNDGTYTRITCGTVPSVVGRFARLQALSDPVAPSVRTVVKESNPLVDVNTYTSSVGAYHRLAMLRNGRRMSASPLNTFRLDTTSAADDLSTMSIDPNAFFLQGDDLFRAFSHDVKRPPMQSVGTVSPQVMMEAVRDGVVPSSYASYAPHVDAPNLPFGILYNNFNTSRAKTLAAAGAGASRYYSITRTPADTGAFMEAWGGGESADDGFTIRLFLKATPETQGFAFAVTDALEDLSTGGSPILDVAMTLMATNADASSWFDNDYHIYSSLYVDGPGRQLKFVTASPRSRLLSNTTQARSASSAETSGSGKLFQVVAWDLEQLGVTRLLNGMWHEVVLTLQKANNLYRVLLTVDGETSQSEQGWNQCLSQRPERVATFAPGTQVLTFNTTQTVTGSGMVWTGYLNGGVGNLEFKPAVMDRFNILLQSSPVVRAANVASTGGFRALGAVLIVVSLLLLAYALYYSTGALRRDSTAAAQEALDAAKLRYYTFCNGTCDLNNSPLITLPFATAKRWLNVNDEQLALVMEELEMCSIADYTSGQTLFTMLYNLRREDRNDETVAPKLPCASDWTKLVELDAEEYAKGTCCSSPVDESDTVNIQELEARCDMMGLEKKEGPEDEQHEAEGSVREVSSPNKPVSKMEAPAAEETSSTSVGVIQPVESVTQMLLPALSSIQALFLWMSTGDIASTYRKYFENFFSFLSIDWVWAFDLPTIATPVIQMFIGLMIALLMPYFLARDDSRFLAYVARYVLRRDECKRNKQQQKDELMNRSLLANVLDLYSDPFGKAANVEQTTTVALLSPSDRLLVDEFLESDEQSIVLEVASGKITITQTNATKVARDSGSDLLPTLSISCSGDMLKPSTLELVGAKCPCHKSRLAQQMQTDMYPFIDRRRCSAVVDGVRCSSELGLMHICTSLGDDVQQQAEADSKAQPNGPGAPCDFALCSNHCRPSVVDNIAAGALGTLHQTKVLGAEWTVAFVLMILANAAYMPFVKTAIMILACHPMYQCEFTCHDFNDRKYLAAFYLSLCVVILFGVGIPVLQAIQLKRRNKLLHEALQPAGTTDGVPDKEWLRFAATDASMLSGLYDSLRFEWLYLSPIILLWKVLIICPAVFIPYGTLGQAVGISAVQIGFSCFISFTGPFLSPVSDLMYRVSEVHQLMFLGLQAIDTADRYEGRKGASDAMSVLTFIFLVFTVGFAVLTKAREIITQKLAEKKMKKLLEVVGLHSARTASIYMVPVSDTVAVVKNTE